jgi:integrase
MATFIKRSNGWLAQVRLKGADPQFQTFPTKAAAVIWAGQVEAEIRAKKNTGKSINKSVHDALIEYQKTVTPNKKGKRWEHIRIDKLIRELPFIGKLIGEVTVADISQWRDARLKEVMSSSVNREMNILSAVYTIAVREWGWCEHNPVRDAKRPKNPKHRDRLTSDEEKQAMLDALGYVDGAAPVTVGQRVAYAYLIALETAMRAGEICALPKKYIYLDKKYVHVRDSKNDESRDVPLSSRAVELFKLVPDGVGITSSQIDAMWRKARANTEGKVVDLKFHDSRHQAITNLAKKLNVLELARMVGHKNPKTLMIYFNDTATTMADKLG